MMKIVEPGLLTSVQDLGRPGLQRFGVTPGGAVDPVALRVGNLLVGNAEGVAGLEITLVGPQIEFQADALIALTGADLAPEIAGVPLPTWRAIIVSAGATISFGQPRWGCRTYLTVAGGIEVPPSLGSRSTHLAAGFGGHQGRRLQTGDSLEIGRRGAEASALMQASARSSGPLPFALTDQQVSLQSLAEIYEAGTSLRVLPGPERDQFSPSDQRALVHDAFELSPSSDRMGCRLSGPRLDSGAISEIISRPVTAGSIQVPAGGQPIVLLADRQTSGGYPVIADVISADIHCLAQMKPGDEVRFRWSTLPDAHSALSLQEERLQWLRKEVGSGAQG